MQTAEVPNIHLLPGERLVAGRVYCFDMDARADFLACMAKVEAPASLASLSDDELTALKYAGIRLAALSYNQDDLLPRVSAEARRRGMDSAGRRIQTLAAA